eukprot:gene1803-945_t
MYTKYSGAMTVMEPTVRLKPDDVTFKPYKHEDIFIQLRCMEVKHEVPPEPEQEPEPSREVQEIEYKRPKTIGENMGVWNTQEHNLFLRGFKKYGRNWSIIAKEFVTTRTRQQVRSHAQKFFRKNQMEPEDIE